MSKLPQQKGAAIPMQTTRNSDSKDSKTPKEDAAKQNNAERRKTKEQEENDFRLFLPTSVSLC